MSAAEEPTPFQQAVDGLELDPDNSSCIFNTEGGGSQMGGIGDSVDINNIVILIVLFHGIINLTEDDIRQQIAPSTIDTSSLPNIENLAYLGVPPTGMVNIGLIQELDIIKKIVEHDMSDLITSSIQSSLQSIEDKASKIIDSSLTDVRTPIKKDTRGIFSRVCNFCFKFMRPLSLLADSVRSIVNYNFQDSYSVCKKIIPVRILSNGGGKRNRQDDDDPSKNSFSMSHDMCVLLFDDLRKSMKRFDGGRFPMICHGITTPTGKAALANCDARCRQLHIVKGFGSGPLPLFVNKNLAYNHIDDGIANMGVIKLSFYINEKGEVKYNSERFHPHLLMNSIVTSRIGDVIWSNMEKCIRHCTSMDPGGKTVCVVDLSCSGIVNGAPQMRDLGLAVACPGGGKGNKKKPKSTKRARRNSRSKRIRNIRNRRKYKNNTKKLKKSRRQ
jgi:hypothetical protein